MTLLQTLLIAIIQGITELFPISSVAHAVLTPYLFHWDLEPEFLKEHFLVCGMFYGIAVFLVMNLIVLPLCAFHYTGPYQLRGLLQGLIVHMLIIGLPIAYCLKKLS